MWTNLEDDTHPVVDVALHLVALSRHHLACTGLKSLLRMSSALFFLFCFSPVLEQERKIIYIRSVNFMHCRFLQNCF